MKLSRKLEGIGTITIIAGIFLVYASPELGVGIGMVGLFVFVIGRFQ